MADDHQGRIVVLTGAGVSQESGLSTFRDEGGVWSQVNIEDVATPEAFVRDPGRVHAFYNARRDALTLNTVAPNPAHEALSRLEAEWPGDVLLVTQNVDDLHERAGSRAVLHMHGELAKIRCTACHHVRPWEGRLTVRDVCSGCASQGTLRPNVVWFGEMPFYMEDIFQALARCDLFVSIGTSGAVYPAAGFVDQVRGLKRALTVELNLEPSDGASRFAHQIYGPASEVVPAFVDRLLDGGIGSLWADARR